MRIGNVILPLLLSCCMVVTVAAQEERTDTLRPAVSSHPLSSGNGQGGRLPVPKKRPRVAVVLSGGGAKGMAHIGVLKVIERAGIPVDIVTGTSMGSIVGGLYACGWNAMELDSIVRRQDWKFLLSDRGEYHSQDLDERKRQNTYILSKTFTLQRHSIEKGGLIEGRNLMKLFRHLTAGYTDSMDFSRLPILFACVSTDIVDNTEYDWHCGRLPVAMRASMSIPAVFSPVRVGGHVLVDGGLRNNYPVDLARQMGADYVIGATVQDPPRTASDLKTSGDILLQIVDVNCKNKYDENMANTDVLVRVNTKGYTPASFTPAAIDTLIRRGEEGAMEHWGQLMALKMRLGLPVDYRPTLRHASAVARRPVNYVDSVQLQRPVTTVQGSLAVKFDTEEMVSLQFNGILRPKHSPTKIEATLRLGRRVRADLQASWTPHHVTTISMGYTFLHNDAYIYSAGQKSQSLTYNQHHAQLSLLGINLHNFAADLFASWDYYHFNQLLSYSDSEEEMGNDGLRNAHFYSYHARVRYDSQGPGLFPTKGTKFMAEYAYFTDNLVGYNGHAGFSELTAYWLMSLPLSKRLTLRPLLYGRMLFGKDIPMIRSNFIGGMWMGNYVSQQLPFDGFYHLEAVDRQIVAAQLRLQLQLTTNNYVNGSFTAGQQAYGLRGLLDRKTMLGGQIGYFYRTILGPIGAVVGYSNVTKQVGAYLQLGFQF